MSENNENKKYESYKIPSSRQADQRSGFFQASPKTTAKPISSLDDGIFYEIEYDSCPIPGAGKFVLKPQKIEEPQKDEIRDLFDQMRDIARTYGSTYNFSRFFDRRVHQDNAAIFYKQGMFMKDFTDNYSGNKQFSQYFPNYQLMGYEQLRTYFTWRTEVRNGNVTDISVSYAFLYIYELLSNIGVNDSQDGLDKLMFFWKNFRIYDKTIDKYVLRWLKDYYIYYELPLSWEEFVKKYDLAESYPNIAKTDFDLFCSISKYDIRKSTFFTDETSQMITDCFSYVLEKIRKDFETVGMNFDEALFHPTKKIVTWDPFKDALFYHWVNQPDRQIIFSKNEIYMYKRNQWTFSTNITTEKGRQFISYIMKQMEADLRKITKYRFKLTANINMVHEETIRRLTKKGLFVEKIVTDAVTLFHREATKTVVRVDSDSLARIRQEALITQEALIVEEQTQQKDILIVEEQTQQKDILIVEEQTQQKDITPVPILFSTQNQNVFADSSDTEYEPSSSVWDGLKDNLSEEEVQALVVILKGDDLKLFADECGVMLEVLVDGINEKAMDYIGDNLIDEEFILYDDYKYQVKEMVG